MKRTVERTIEFCDFCQVNEATTYSRCLRCGKAPCWDEGCRKAHMVEFDSSVHYCRTVYFCKECDAIIKKDGSDPLYNLCQDVTRIRDEQKRFYDAWEKKADALDKLSERLLNERQKAFEK